MDAFKNSHVDRGKLHFYSIFNEAIAYKYLKERGFLNVSILSENKKNKVPDISYVDSGRIKYCEVKTIDVSDEEIARGKSGEAYDGSVYLALSKNFLEIKLKNTIVSAIAQLRSVNGDGLIFLNIRLDDFTHTYLQEYEQQLIAFLQEYFPSEEIYIKFGLMSGQYLYFSLRD